MEDLRIQLLSGPLNQFRHEPGRIEGRRGLEYDAKELPVRPEGPYIVRRRLIGAAEAFILGAVRKKVTTKLLDVVLAQGDLAPACEDRSMTSA